MTLSPTLENAEQLIERLYETFLFVQATIRPSATDRRERQVKEAIAAALNSTRPEPQVAEQRDLAREITRRFQWAHEHTYKEDMAALFREVLIAADPIDQLRFLTLAAPIATTALRSSPTVRNRDEVLEEAAMIVFEEVGNNSVCQRTMRRIRALKDTRGLGLT